MKKGKKLVIGILVFLVTSIFYREFTLKNNEAKNKEITENKELVKNEQIIKTETVAIEKTEIVENSIEKEITFNKEDSTEVVDEKLAQTTIEESTLEDLELENKIAKEWDDQEGQELADLDSTIDLEEKIVLENMEYVIKKGDTI